uniref:Odorant binding protein 23 n=1 Tax=Colaphellus bowringi TaxID=561076 RepID=A0A0S3J2M8_9CUCU|nr:odorant binding protein 23 [Colaphellus bowringi]
MKFLVLGFFAFGFIAGTKCLSEENMKEIEEFQKSCVAEVHTSPDVLSQIMSGDVSDDPKIKAHLLCFAKKAGVMTESGETIMDKLKQKLNQYLGSKADGFFEKCNIEITTPEDTAFNVYKCLSEMLQEGK